MSKLLLIAVAILLVWFMFHPKTELPTSPKNYVAVNNIPCQADKDCIGKSSMFPVMKCYKATAIDVAGQTLCHIPMG